MLTLTEQLAELRIQIDALVKANGSTLTEIYGVGPVVAATIIGHVVDIRRYPRHHFATANGTAPIPASSGRTVRHRLNRGGEPATEPGDLYDRAIAAAALAAASPTGAQADPPFSGTVFIDADVITASDPTTFTRAHYCCIRERMFDRRVNDTITVDAHIIAATRPDGACPRTAAGRAAGCDCHGTLATLVGADKSPNRRDPVNLLVGHAREHWQPSTSGW